MGMIETMIEATRKEGAHDQGFNGTHVEWASFLFYARNGDMYEAVWTSDAGWAVYILMCDDAVYSDE